MSEKTINNTAYLCAELCKYIGITADTVDTFVLRHYDVWDKQCPAQWATENNSGCIANGGGVCRKSYYNSNLPGTKFCTPDWSIVEESEDLTMSQYTELKELIEKQAAEINDLRNVNQQLVNVVQTTMIYNYVDDNMPDWARTAVQAAMSFGAIRGDENGRLGLSYKDLRAICREYRCGLYNR